MEFKTAYIAGPVSGKDPGKVAGIFSNKERELKEKGYVVVNPILVVGKLQAWFYKKNKVALSDMISEHREIIMNHCISHMAICGEVHLLPGWQDSKGATMERDVAQRMGKKIIYP